MWPNWNATAKDLLIKRLFKDMVELRIERERNITPELYVPIHYMSNPDCVNALRNALCWYNFPKCNDENRSLPLCKSTCNEYYKACKFKPSEAGLFPFCEKSSIEKLGLFNSGIEPGPDQTLAEDKKDTHGQRENTCERQPTDSEIGITAEVAATVWYKTWWGILSLTVGGLVAVALFAFLLIPPVLMEYLVTSFKRLLKMPYKAWMFLPQLKGKKVLIIQIVVFLALMIVGIYNTITGGFSRWNKFKDDHKEAEYQFKPPTYIWGTQAIKPLTNQQLRQMQESCACTGDAFRDAPCFLSLLAAIAWAWHQ